MNDSKVRRTGTWTAIASLLVLGLVGSVGATSSPQGTSVPSDLIEKVKSAVKSDTARLVAIFKDIHQNPELGFAETRTAGIVAKELQDLGYEVQTGIGRTGVVGILKNGPGPTLMYRADMDANPVAEETGVPYASKVRVKRADGVDVPVAHMCGHDAHVTWMLGVAKVMSEMKDQWSGTLVMVGQPAEELLMGARAMIDDGLYTKHGVPVPDYLIGLHTQPFPTGTIVASGGTRQAGTDQIDVTIFGVGGHGSSPRETKDPVVMAALAVVQYQTIVSRVIDPSETAVLTVGSIQAGTDNNVIPETALLKINTRFFSEKARRQMIDGIRRINEGIAKAQGMPSDKMPAMVMKGTSSPLVNDPALVGRVTPTLKSLLGEKNVRTEFPPLTASEDFHVLAGSNATRVMFLLVGTAAPALVAAARDQGKSVPFSNHSPKYLVDLEAIPVGATIGAMTTFEFLAKGAPVLPKPEPHRKPGGGD